MDRIYSLGDVSRMLGVQAYRITYAISTGVLQDTAFRFNNKRVFTTENIEQIARYFKVERNKNGITTQKGAR